jgi:TPR repeat protein
LSFDEGLVEVTVVNASRYCMILIVPLLANWAHLAFAKPIVLKVQPEANQMAVMDRGSQIITSQQSGSTLIMQAPEPFEGSRVIVNFTFVNNSSAPVNIGPENLSSAQIAVITYDQLMAEQRKSEKWDRLAAGLGALGNSLSATDAGRQYSTTTATGYVNCGFNCNATVRGYGTTQTYNPYAAQQAQLQAQAQNNAEFERLRAQNQLERGALGVNLRTTTVMPGQYLNGLLTFAVPREMRRSKTALPFSLAVTIGADVHILKGFGGPLGVVFPSPAAANKSADLATTRVVSPGGASSANLSAQDAYTRGVASYNGQGVPQDFAAAAGWFHQSADKGLALAQTRLGWMYDNGKGVPLDSGTAATWYRKAADQGAMIAQYQLAAMYKAGKGVPEDFAIAASWYRKAADQGYSSAQFNLGAMYETGSGVPLDFTAAANWYRKAADQGHARAQEALSKLTLGRGK